MFAPQGCSDPLVAPPPPPAHSHMETMMAQFELTLTDSFRMHEHRCPQEFQHVCVGLTLALAYEYGTIGVGYGHGRVHRLFPTPTRPVQERAPLGPGLRRIAPRTVTGTIPIPDQQADAFE